ncbi:MAG: metal ABC transporter substrate-binding protein [Bdellovibrionota bacterium]
MKKFLCTITTFITALLGTAAAQASPLRICATVPDLGAIAREVGGAQVEVTVFAKGVEDPHFVEARPSFIKALSRCDLYLQVGLELEIGWAPLLLQSARNGKVLPGNPGFLDASEGLVPLGVPTGPVDRSMGDVHAGGNPHYLLDPLEGLRVARLIRDRLGMLSPENRAGFEANYEASRKEILSALLGESLAAAPDAEEIAQRYAAEGPGALGDKLQGWLGALSPYYGSKIVTDHDLWPYFARRFGLVVVGHLEPKPGVPPTARHLAGLVERMKAEKSGAILTSAYFDPRHARFVSENTGARVAELANQVGSRPGTESYLQMVDYNVRQTAKALGGGL